jgi:hypothetical protein
MRDIQKKYCSQAMIAAIVAALVLIMFGEKSIGKGLVLGSLFSIINFIIMGQFIPLRLAQSQSKSKASAIAFVSIFLRFAILAIPLIISIKVDAVHFAGVVIGLFMVQLLMLFDQLILNRFLSEKKT